MRSSNHPPRCRGAYLLAIAGGFIALPGSEDARSALPGPAGSACVTTWMNAPSGSSQDSPTSEGADSIPAPPPATSPPRPATSLVRPGTSPPRPCISPGAQLGLRSTAPPVFSSPRGVAASHSSQRGNEIIYDSLCITDFQSYDNGFGATCGGQDILGREYDLQAADDFVLLRDSLITETVTDFISFIGECPPAVCVQFFAADGCVPAEQPTCSVTLEPICMSYTDTIFSLEGVRIFAAINGACRLPAGRWFVSVQPRTRSDWYYQNMEYCPPLCGDCECSALVRDGGEDNPCCDGEGGFGSPDWALYSGEQWTTAMRIEVGGLDTAACCFDDLTCEDLLPSECHERGGRAFLDESCPLFECPPEGACCHADGRCEDQIADDCAAHDGVWYGGESCATMDCPPFGACCLGDGRCLYLPEGRCLEMAGEWHAGVDCSGFDCVRMGVCCLDGLCLNMREVECAEKGGDFTYGRQCDYFHCPQQGACCLGDADCRMEFEDDCAAQGGVFQGDFTQCNLQCHAERVRRLRAKCSDSGAIRVRVVFKDHSADGRTVYLTIDNDVYTAGVVDRRAVLFAAPFRGAHTVALVEPPADLTVDVDCPP
ncbi:MAG: hypothetical protein IT449_02265 [Phycisphaerales bacterium]|nr:hypothetical protein [Phycisphaerales bacterium]